MAGRHEPSEGPDDEAAEDPRDQRAEHHGSRLGPVPLRRAASAAAVQLEAPSGGRREVGRSARRRRSTSSQATRSSRSFMTSCRGASASLSVVSARSSAAVPSTFWPTTRTDQETSWRVPEPYEVSVTVRCEVESPGRLTKASAAQREAHHVVLTHGGHLHGEPRGQPGGCVAAHISRSPTSTGQIARSSFLPSGGAERRRWSERRSGGPPGGTDGGPSLARSGLGDATARVWTNWR